MSKELSPLEALNEVVYCYGYDKNIEIIETALKDQEETNSKLDNLFESLGIESKEDLIKKLKTLEILKAFDFEIEDYDENNHGAIKVKGQRIILDDEEFDLLREVLL